MNTNISGDFQICISVPLSYNGFGGKRRHLFKTVTDRLNIIPLVKNFCSVSELFSRLRSKVCHKMMIHNH